MKKLISLSFLLCGLLLGGCAQQTQPASSPGVTASPQVLIKRLKEIDQQRIAKPQDIALRAEQADIQKKLVNDYLLSAEKAAQRNDYAQASLLWRDALDWEPGNFRARQGLDKVEARRALDKLYRDAVAESRRDPERALHKVQKVLEEDPNWPQARAMRDYLLREVARLNQPENRLSRELQKPVSLNFREHSLLAIFNTISQLTGVNIIFDKDIPPTATASLIAKRTTAEDAIDVLLLSSGMRKKVAQRPYAADLPGHPAEREDLPRCGGENRVSRLRQGQRGRTWRCAIW
jgi:hypothetical protein